MATLTMRQVAQYAAGAGLPADKLAVAVAIAKGESGLRTDARGDVGLQTGVWGPSLGLWQVRSLKAQTGTGKARDASRLTDPTFNARSMVEISSSGRNWRPWTVYTTGAYLAHLPAAQRAVAELGPAGRGVPGRGDFPADAPVTATPAGGPGIDDIIRAGSVGPAGWIGQLVAGIRNPVDAYKALVALVARLFDRDTWVRVLKVVAGMAGLILGAVLLSRDVLGQAAGTVIPPTATAVVAGVA